MVLLAIFAQVGSPGNDKKRVRTKPVTAFVEVVAIAVSDQHLNGLCIE